MYEIFFLFLLLIKNIFFFNIEPKILILHNIFFLRKKRRMFVSLKIVYATFRNNYELHIRYIL